MAALRERIRRVDKILLGHSPMKSKEWDAEVVCLHLRKSLEHLAFASLIAHRETYSAVYRDFSTHWNAKRLIDKLEKVHPGFYPTPVAIPSLSFESTKHLTDVTDGYLTKDEFVELYNVCSSVIHTRNPFHPGEWVIDARLSFSDWANRLKRLLDVHYIRLAGVPGMWLVQMVGPSDGQVHVFTCKPMAPT